MEYKSKRFFELFLKPIMTGFIVFVIFIQAIIALSSFYQNDGAGYFLVDFDGNSQGVDTTNDITINTTAGIAEITSPATEGDFTLDDVIPQSFTAWDEIIIKGTQSDPSGTDILYTIEDCDENPIPNFENIPLLPSTLGIIDISTIDKDTYPCIKVKILLSEYSGIYPTIDYVKVIWVPEPKYLITETITPIVPAGSIVNIGINYSVSYVTDTNTVVWATIPTVVDGSYTGAYYLQDPTTSFVSASNGGVFTGSSITVSGIDIPANSVYWNLGNVSAGSSGSLSFKVQPPNGLENDMEFESQAFIDSILGTETPSDSSIITGGDQTTVFIISSEPAPSISKTVDGVLAFEQYNYVINGGIYDAEITYNIVFTNGSSTGTETIFEPEIVDDISDILTKLQTVSCGSLTENQILNLFTINNGGIYSFADQSITWDVNSSGFNNINPGGQIHVSYDVDYTSCLDSGLTFENHVAGSSNNSPAVEVSSNIMVTAFTPNGLIILLEKGEKINGVSSVTGGADDFPKINQSYGDPNTYIISEKNKGAVAAGDVILFDRIPDGQTFNYATNISSPDLTGVNIYYSTEDTLDPQVPPSQLGTPPGDILFTSGVGITDNLWSTTLPLDPADVKWVAAFVPCLDSFYIPATGGICQNQASEVRIEIGTTINSSDTCSSTVISNIAYSEVYAKGVLPNNDSLTTVPMESIVDLAEETHVTAKKPSFVNGVNVTGPNDLIVNQSGLYTLAITNKGTDKALATEVIVRAPYVDLYGNTAYLPFSGVPTVSGGSATFTYFSDPQNKEYYYTINFTTPILVNDTVTITVPVYNSSGELKNADTFQVTASVSAEDDVCGLVIGTGQKSTSVTAYPKLITHKDVDENIIDPAGDIHYTISYINTGNSPTSNTFIVDKISNKTIFKNAYTDGTDENNNAYTCTNCQVYFSNDNGANWPTSGLPPNLSVTTPLNENLVQTYFTLGTESNGVWSSPYGDQTTWVAYKLSQSIGLDGVTLPNETATIGLTVTNDDDGTGPNSTGSPNGTTITNAPGIFSHESLQAIDNQVYTLILPDPGLRINKESYGLTPNENVVTNYFNAGESFNWDISYYNDSGNDDTAVVITDTFPALINIGNIYHTWNANTPLSQLEVQLVEDTDYTITNNFDGTKTITIDIVAFRGGNLANLEGGLIRIESEVNDLAFAPTIVQNNVLGSYENISNSLTVSDSDIITVINPDLWIRKFVDMSDPIAGETINYTLIISNEGLHYADGVTITDILPEGLCYNGPTSVSSNTDTWELGEPTITYSDTDCTDGTTTLTWENVIENTSDNTDPGFIPANSDDIQITYAVDVDNSVEPGTELNNIAEISGDISEAYIYEGEVSPNGIYANTSNQTINTPLPDPKVVKSVPLIVLSGENVTYTVSYSNISKQGATEVYLVDTLPDYDSDNTPDMKFISISSSNNETFYYNVSGATDFDYDNPTANNWSTDYTAIGGPVAYIVIVPPGGELAGNEGPYDVGIVLQATDPDNDQVIQAGNALTNNVTIYQNPNDDDVNSANNTSFATTNTPSIDLYVTKTANHEGAYPGIEPGTNITYTITGGNQGIEDACAIRLNDTLSAGLTEQATFENFSTQNLILYDDGDNIVHAKNTLGVEILTNVSVSFSAGEWRIGGVDYQDVCLPPRTHFTFNVYATADITDADPDSIYVDGQEVSNTITIAEDSVLQNEYVTENNTDVSEVTVYRADVLVNKTGVSCGLDDACGNGDDNVNAVNVNEIIKYTVEYQNSGDIDAQNVSVEDVIPVDTCFRVGSITGLQNGETIKYYTNSNQTGTYVPVADGNGTDCDITKIAVDFSTLGVLSDYLGEGLNEAFTGTFESTHDYTGTDGYHFLSLGENNFSSIDLDTDLTDGILSALIDDGDAVNDIMIADKVYKNISTFTDILFDTGYDLPYFILKHSLIYDFDDDGQNDILGYNGNASPFIWHNNSSGGNVSFDTNTAVLPNNNAVELSTKEGKAIIEDVDGDGIVDIINTGLNHLDDNLVFFVTRNISVQNTVTLGATTMVDTGVTLDPTTNNHKTFYHYADGDLQKDVTLIVVDYINNTSYIYTYINTSVSGTVSFDAPIITQLPTYSSFVYSYMEDLNDDDIEDLIVVNEGYNTYFYRGNAGPTVFENPYTLPLLNNNNFATTLNVIPNDMFVDLNGDSLPEFFGRLDYSYGNTGTYCWENTSTAFAISFATCGGVTSGYNNFAKLVDYDNDGDLDVLSIYGVGGAPPVLNISINNTPNTIGIAPVFATPFALYIMPNETDIQVLGSVNFADLDGDDYPDILLNDAGVGTLLILHNGTGQSGTASIDYRYDIIDDDLVVYDYTPYNNSSVLIEDLNADGLVDLVLGNQSPTSKVYHNYSVPGMIILGGNNSQGSGTYKYSLSSIASGKSLKKLYVNEEIPDGTSITYEILDQCSGGSTVFSETASTLDVVDLSSVISNGQNCLVIHFDTDNINALPKLNSWQMSYSNLNPTSPFFTFEVYTNSQFTSNNISNTVNITTDTEEKSVTNNSSTYNMSVISADLEMVKTVDSSAVHAGDPLVYTLTYTNLGPQSAQKVAIIDTMPALFTFVSVDSSTPTSAGQTLVCNQDSQTTIYCDDDGDNSFGSNLTLAPGESGTITITGTVDLGAVSGNSFTNMGRIDSDNGTLGTIITYDPNLENNVSTVIVLVGDYPNVHIDKSAPATVHIDENITFTLVYGNNGNVVAEDVEITDTLDSNLTFVSADDSNDIFDCDATGQLITCDGTDLAVGQTGTITIIATVADDEDLLLNGGYKIINIGHILTTTMPEVTQSDNHSSSTTRIIPEGNGSISGYVYNDSNENGSKGIFESGIAGVEITLTGTDYLGNSVSVTQTTISNGSYFFAGLPAGVYEISESQPSGYTSTESSAGSAGGEGSLENNLISKNSIEDINLNDGENGEDYNFGELSGDLYGTIGNLIFDDENENGIHDPGEDGIEGVTVRICYDINNNENCDNNETTVTETTNAQGLYLFGALPLDEHYIIVVTDTSNELNGKSVTILSGNNDNQGKDPDGYLVYITNASPINLTADFAYYEDDDTTGSNCTLTNTCPTTSTGSIGNLVFFDKNKNGIFDDGDYGKPNVSVALYTDTDNNEVFSPGDQLVKVEFTNACSIISCVNAGRYKFENLSLGSTNDGKRYYVVVTDVGNKLKGFKNILGTSTSLDNHGKDPKGYIVDISKTIPNDMTADFGYTAVDELPTTGDEVYFPIVVLGIITLLSITILTKKLLL